MLPSATSSPLTCFYFFIATTTTEIYTLSLHDALPILQRRGLLPAAARGGLSHCLYTVCTALSPRGRSEEHTSELQSHSDLVCRLLLEKKKNNQSTYSILKNSHSHCDCWYYDA